MMRYEHYERVVRWDRRNRFPERAHEVQRPGLEKITRIWGRKAHGYDLAMVSAVSGGRHMRTGRRPKRVYTKRSVASRRLKKGDPVGCMVQVSGKEAYGRREQRMVLGRPEMRPFSGLGTQGKGTVDQRGKVTFHLSQPGVRRPRRAHYEEYYGLVQKATAGSAGKRARESGRYRSRETGATSLAVGRERRSGRRIPLGIRGKGGPVA
jgi:ribosomal protein L5